jgi:hypothetical protein
MTLGQQIALLMLAVAATAVGVDALTLWLATR